MLCAHTISQVAERAATKLVSEPHPLENLVVASVKHCSILALDVLYFRSLRSIEGGPAYAH